MCDFSWGYMYGPPIDISKFSLLRIRGRLALQMSQALTAAYLNANSIFIGITQHLSNIINVFLSKVCSAEIQAIL